MTEVHSPQTPPRSELRQLLRATDRDPVELVEEIRVAREDRTAAAGVGVARDLDTVEMRFLLARAARSKAGSELRAEVERAERAWLAHQRRSLAEAEPGAAFALFDLVELRASLRGKGMADEAAQVAVEIAERVASIDIDDALLEEARERYVALSTEEEDLTLEQKIYLLDETSSVLEALAERSDNRLLRRMAKRLWRAKCDRMLARRLERVLTRPGAAILETTSLVLLVLLFALLAIESVVPMSEANMRRLFAFDAGICTFFIAEFLFKLSLSPARVSWFLRNAVTDLLPALPAAMLFLNIPNIPAVDEAIYIRVLRFMRIAYFARYVQALRPVLRVFRLLLFMVRGMDHLVRRFSSLLNRNFVFFDVAPSEARAAVAEDPNGDVFRAIRREHVLLEDMPSSDSAPVAVARARRLTARLSDAPPAPRRPAVVVAEERDVPVERVIEQLHATRPDELALWMPRSDMLALDRVVRVINAPLIRSLPFIRKLRSPRLAESPEERVTDLGKRVANRLETWRERILFFADMHGILTGPQILDRVASTMVNAAKRPAVRLLLFGGLFLMVRAIVGDDSIVGEFLKRFVATPLLVLGSVCLVVLWLGRWLKRLAGEAAETLKRTSEAHFIALIELQKSRDEDVDTAFLARRVFRWELKPAEAQWALCKQVELIRNGEAWQGEVPAGPIRDDVNRVALLYLHFRDGAILHETDVKTTEQLLANLSLENIRSDHLAFTRRDRKRLRKLSLDEGSLFSGPYLWFRCITESVALETAKRVIDYNRHCLPLAGHRHGTPDERAEMDRWVEKRRAEMAGRLLERTEAPDVGPSFVTTEFNALDFLSADRNREDHVERIFGGEVLKLLQRDREHMIREIFGTRALDRLPRSRRILNFYTLYTKRLSGGRILLLPLYWMLLVGRALGFAVSKTVDIVREIMAPELAQQTRQSGRARFAVALRKIHRMKAPGLLEAIATRVAFDPAYGGASPTWSEGTPQEEVSELERDLDFLAMKERDREELRDRAAEQRRWVEACHFQLRDLPPLADVAGGIERRFAERAVTIAYTTDRRSMRTLLRAEEWFERALLEYEAPGARVPLSHVGACARFLLRRGGPHPVARWLDGHLAHRKVSRRARRNFAAAYDASDRETRATVDAWLELAQGTSPGDRGIEIARDVYLNHGEVSRELAALRAVQSLSVLDVRNYRQLVFRLGRYDRDGEDAVVATALP